MEKNTCCEPMPHGSRWNRTWKPCGKAAKAERDGKWYCGIHDPEKRKAQQAAFYGEGA